MSRRLRVIGLDFSGAKDCGKRIWIAEGDVRGARLTIRRLNSASGRLDVGDTVSAVMPALRNFICRSRGMVIGGDFPASLSDALIGGGSGANFLRSFHRRFPDADSFRAWCSDRIVGERMAKRACDKEAKTPFAPNNLRLYKQTWSAMYHLLGPLILAHKLSIAPLTQHFDGRPLFLECCPASSLQHLGLREPYKGTGSKNEAARVRILNALRRKRWITIGPEVLRIAVENRGGDALDALIAAAAAARALVDLTSLLPRRPRERVEGRVYFA